MIMAGFGFRLVLMLVLVFVTGTATCSNEGKKERKDVSKKDGRQKSDQISTLLWLHFSGTSAILTILYISFTTTYNSHLQKFLYNVTGARTLRVRVFPRIFHGHVRVRRIFHGRVFPRIFHGHVRVRVRRIFHGRVRKIFHVRARVRVRRISHGRVRVRLHAPSNRVHYLSLFHF